MNPKASSGKAGRLLPAAHGSAERCKVAFDENAAGPFCITKEWMMPSEALDFAAGCRARGRMEIQIITHKKQHGRWKFAGRVNYPPNVRMSEGGRETPDLK